MIVSGEPGGRPTYGIVDGNDDVWFAAVTLEQGSNDAKVS